VGQLADARQPAVEAAAPTVTAATTATAYELISDVSVGATAPAAVDARPWITRSFELRIGVIGAAGAALAITAWWAGSRSSVLQQPVLTAAFWVALLVSYLGAGLFTWWRRRESRLGPLITANTFVYGGLVLTASSDAFVHTLGMVAWSVNVLYAAYVYLCFPGDSLTSRAERRFLIAFGVVIAVLWLLILPLAPHAPNGGPLVSCGSSCPVNGFQVISGGDSVGTALVTLLKAVLTVGPVIVAALIVHHARTAPPLRRRTITPLAWAALGSTGAFVVSLLVLGAYPGAGQTLRVISGVFRVSIPLTLLIGQIRGSMFAARSLGRIAVRASGERLTPTVVRTMLSDALRDPSLELALWSEPRGCYVGADGETVVLADQTAGSSITRFTRDGAPIAALIHDPTLETDSELVEGLAATSLMLLENVRLVEELQASRARIVATAQRERLRLERNLHDGAQQRLMAIQVRLRMAQKGAGGAELAQELAAIQHEAAEAVEELRMLAQGIYPSALRDLGLAAALQSMAINGPIPIDVRDAGIGRCSGAVEQAIYFCALEAVQNASKHAGDAARVTIELERDAHEVRFTVADDGVGTDLRTAGGGVGLVSMRDRVGAVGGKLAIRSTPGAGTIVEGSVPDDGITDPADAGAS
jgi:signal transduction histidine kinase